MLRLYARLRGVPGPCIEAAVGQLLQRIDLAEYADRRAEAHPAVSGRPAPCIALLLSGWVSSCMHHHQPAAPRVYWNHSKRTASLLLFRVLD